MPSHSTTKPGTPRLISATVCDSELTACGRRMLTDDDLGVVEVVDQAATAEPSPCIQWPATINTGRRRSAQVGIGAPHLAQRGTCRHPYPGLPGRSQLAVQFSGVGVIGDGQHFGGERVVVGAARAIRASGRLESTARLPYRGRSALLHVAVTPARNATISSRAKSLPGSLVATTSATDTARDCFPTRTRRTRPEPTVGGVIECPWVIRGVHRVIFTGLVIVHEAEAAAHHRIADLTDRQGSGNRARPPEPHQLIGTREFVDRGATVEPVDPRPQCQRLCVAQHVTDRAGDHDALPSGHR